MENTEIVVGTDGSSHSVAAVRWAAVEARRRDVPLRVLFAYDWNWEGARFGAGDQLRRVEQERAERAVADAADEARTAAPGLTLNEVAVIGDPATSLLDAASHAALVVVGNRGRGGFASLLLGSVSQRVATHATCPVVVVRGREDAVDGPIVVGADGSRAAGDALGLAFELAAARGCGLVAVRTYATPTPPWGADVQPLVYDREKLKAAEHADLAESLSPWRDKYPRVSVEALVTGGSAARVLVGVSHTAQLVVVGSRGRGTMAGTLLGSVGLQLLHHADCPVLVAHRR